MKYKSKRSQAKHGVMDTKRGIRDRIKKELMSQSPATRKSRSAVIHKKLFGLGVFKAASSVCFYVARPPEVETLPMIEEAIALGKIVVVPRTDLEKKELELYQIQNPEKDLARGAFGILEPIPSRTRRVEASQIECVIVPGIAFDAAGHRVGRGGGFYDRWLKTLGSQVPKIGLAFSFQVLSSIPFESHDQKVDLVLTELTV